MKKRIFGRKLSRERDSRRALIRSLTRALVMYKAISTTKAKAKTLIPFVERLVTIAKKADVSAKRRVNALLGNDRQTVEALFKDIMPYLIGKSGFTRIINLPERLGDRAKMVRLEWAQEIAVGDKKQVISKKGEEKQKVKIKNLPQAKSKNKGKV